MDPYDGPTRHAHPVEVGDVLTLEVEQLGLDGDGLCRVQNYVVFVPGVLAGEVVEVEIVSAGRKHARGVLRAIETASPDRVEPPCPHYGACGGCQLQHLAYTQQLAFKTEAVRRRLRQALERDEVGVAPCLGPEDPFGHRTRIALQVTEELGHLTTGLYRRRSRRVIGVAECPVSDPAAWRAAAEVVEAARHAGIDAYDDRTGAGTLRTVLVRRTSTGETAATVILRSKDRRDVDALRRAGLQTTCLAINVNPDPDRLLGRHTEVIAGRDEVGEEVAGVRFRLGPTAWFRTSRFAVEAVVETVRRMVDPIPGATVLDLYSGMGLFALTLAPLAGKVIGMEENPRALADAIASKQLNGFANVDLRKGKVESLLAGVREKVYAIVLDPPPGGCGRFVLNAMTKDVRPERIVYVSQDVDGFAEEAAVLCGRGYNLREVQPIDPAPHTGGVEIVALFEGRIVQGKRGSSIAQARRLLRRVRDEDRRPGGGGPDDAAPDA